MEIHKHIRWNYKNNSRKKHFLFYHHLNYKKLNHNEIITDIHTYRWHCQLFWINLPCTHKNIMKVIQLCTYIQINWRISLYIILKINMPFSDNFVLDFLLIKLYVFSVELLIWPHTAYQEVRINVQPFLNFHHKLY